MSCPGAWASGAALPPAGHAAVDELRIVGEQHLRPQAQPLHHPGAEALDQPVGAAAEVARDLHARLEVDRHRSPAARERMRLEALPGPLDADHFGAVVGEHHRGEGPRADPRELDDPYARKRTHQSASTMVTLAMPPPSHIVCSP